MSEEWNESLMKVSNLLVRKSKSMKEWKVFKGEVSSKGNRMGISLYFYKFEWLLRGLVRLVWEQAGIIKGIS